MGLEILVKIATPGAHIASEYRREGMKDYWRAAEAEGTKAVLYVTAGVFGYAHIDKIIQFFQ